ncbi:MAG TPA: molybdenum cofactor biosynthesis protein MoaE, partial [Acidimicrobiia bacterium]|nr:molybdenum cofactor biosynthesis protein MoaE [Acidimicrobiia bacterium]
MVRSGSGDDWLALTDAPLPVDEALQWAVRPDCGAVVLFSGTVRDHAEGRTGVTSLDYEAYAEQTVPSFAAIAEEARVRFPTIGRLALLHRVGPVALTESSVVVVASAPHRAEA